MEVVLVHGAWADGSAWGPVIRKLIAQGLSVTAVQLPLRDRVTDVEVTRSGLGECRRADDRRWSLVRRRGDDRTGTRCTERGEPGVRVGIRSGSR